ncbi:MAG: AsnC family transcriptional regulator [Hyphomicrobiales bacterium]|nr:AsnC family transcriptional regulator [Hyphomicrobiales bacterium]MCP5373781.1 AsnC family transcriptional regulator [Hyphomicrobiales bacterium]
MDDLDRAIINGLQGGFPVCDEPFAAVGADLGVDGDEVAARIENLLAVGALSRFGPLYHAEELGGGLALCAMKVPEADFDRVADQVNAFPEVAHNYARDHAFNMWFVLATETPEGIGETAGRIERATGLRVYTMPKLQEFFVGLRFEV